MSIPKLRVESSVKWRSTSGSASSGRRGGARARELGGHLGHRQVGLRASPMPAAARLRLLVDQLHGASASDEPVDLLDRALLGDGDEQRVVEPGVVAAERVAGVDALRARGRERLARGPSGAHGELLERCLLGKRELEPGRRRAAPSRSRRAPCRSPPARAAPAGRAGSGARAPRARAASGWW